MKKAFWEASLNVLGGPLGSEKTFDSKVEVRDMLGLQRGDSGGDTDGEEQ